MWLQTTWFVLYVLIVVGYVVLDGFDLGVGMLSPFIARNDHDRRILLNAIGPVWDGNEVWLVLGAGALFAAFPLVYASLFSGFYLAIMLILLVLIMRTVAVEFRSKRPEAWWRSLWDWIFTLSSFGITILLGVTLGNVIRGVPLDGQGNMSVDLFALLNPYSLFFGLTAVALLSLHGAIFLTQKTEGLLLDKIKIFLPKLLLIFFIVMTVLILWTVMSDEQFTQNFKNRPWTIVFPFLAFISTVVAWLFIRRGAYLSAFLASATTIALLLGAVASGMYPVMLRSTTNSAYDLTVYNASSANETLTVMLVMALIGMPFVLLYTAGVYFFFRGKVELTDESY
ncbi:MAG: cytochrome d ubiquinol oxidase subunit II [Acidimicrobiales bacterium]